MAATVRHGFFWQDIGTPQDYLEIHRRLLAGEVPGLAALYPHLTDPYLAPGVTLGAAVCLDGGVCLGPDVKVGDGVYLKNTVVWSEAVIASGVHLEDCVVGQGVRVRESAQGRVFADMIIRCFGARGSIPVSGQEYVRYGGDTSCFEIRSHDDDIIIIDAGSGLRRLGKKLLAEHRFAYTLFITHSHWDHILGFPFFKPIYDHRTKINILGCNEAQGDIKKLLSRAMSTPFFPVPFSELGAEFTYEDDCVTSYHVGPVEVFPIHLNHPNGGQGYKFVENR